MPRTRSIRRTGRGSAQFRLQGLLGDVRAITQRNVLAAGRYARLLEGIASDALIGYHRAFIRCGWRIVSAIVSLLGYLWMLWDNEKQTWHDKMARSVVVSVSSYLGV